MEAVLRAEPQALEARLRAMAARAREAGRALELAAGGGRRASVEAMAEALWRRRAEVLAANAGDVEEAVAAGLARPMVKRLQLDEGKVRAMVEGMRAVAALPDPVGEGTGRWVRPNGLVIEQVRVPLGVVGIIYESRPNVTADAAAICVKTANAVLLRGGREAARSNAAIVDALREGLGAAGFPADAVQLVAEGGREAALAMMRLTGALDVLIPRGGAGLIRTVLENARVPVIETGTGNCHVYVERTADLDMARRIVLNAKLSNPAVCNAAEKLLVDRELALAFLPRVLGELAEAGVEVRGCPETRAVWAEARPATEEDWATEYLDLVLGVRVVEDAAAAIAHINRYGTRHSEAIVTNDHRVALRFLREVDAACVYVNASTRFTDGGEFGFGAEVGISTQKLHARGPMGLRELTSTKYLILGDGQVRE